MTGAPLLAALQRVDLQGQGTPLSKTPFLLLKDVLLIIVLGLALMVVLMLWAKYLRGWKPKKRRSQGHKVYRERGDSASSDEDAEDEDEPLDGETPNVRRRYKYRYRRRGHRSRNPTLAETGGLPPGKSGEPTK